jgi:Protein ENHANCED DISEASE RESISTANCE 2, C-terminal
MSKTNNTTSKSTPLSKIASISSGIAAGVGALLVAPAAALPMTMIGASAGYFFGSGTSSKSDPKLVSGRPTLKRLKFIVNWGVLEIENLLEDPSSASPYSPSLISMTGLGPDDSTTPLSMAEASLKLTEILDEVILSFAPWVQRIYFLRSIKNTTAAEKDEEISVIKAHLLPLQHFLEKPRVQEAMALGNAIFSSDWSSRNPKQSLTPSATRKIRSVYPVILETSDLLNFSNEVTSWIFAFMSREDLTAALLLESNGNAQIEPSVTAVPKIPQIKVDLPPIGAEEEYFSADSGSDDETYSTVRETLNHSENLPSSHFLHGITPDEFMKKSMSSLDRNCWDSIDCTKFSVRGDSYFQDKKKFPSFPGFMETLAVDVFYTKKPIHCVSESNQCRAYWLRKENPDWFFFTLNWRCDTLQIAVTLGAPHANKIKSEQHSLAFRNFIKETSDKTRKNKLKIIPDVVDGPWLARKACGSKTPAIIGNKLKCEFHEEPNQFLETEIDVFSSTAARTMMGVLVSTAKKLVIDVGILIESQNTQELPERLIGGFRVQFVDLTACRKLC